MVSTRDDIDSCLSPASEGSSLLSFAVSDQSKPHTSHINSLQAPVISPVIKLTTQRKQELRTKVELLGTKEMSTAFEKFPQSCVKTLVMTTGEFEFDKIFFSSTVSYPYTTYILWIIFIILMPILFNNLLVGLAVGDIQKERDKAILTKVNLQVDLALSLEESLPMARRFWYKNSDKFHPTTSKPLQMFQKMFSTTFEERSESVKTIKRDESHLNHDMEAPDVDPLNEMKRLIEKQECDISELKATVQEILSSVQNPTSGLSQFQSKSVRSMKFRLKKSQLDNPSDSNFADDNAFPLLP